MDNDRDVILTANALKRSWQHNKAIAEECSRDGSHGFVFVRMWGVSGVFVTRITPIPLPPCGEQEARNRMKTGIPKWDPSCINHCR